MNNTIGRPAEMAMFPLGMVLLPTMVVPIHVFEPRYRRMIRDCLDGTREFGVVLIERGSEVGGGDVRGHEGTVATIMDAQELPDGRWGLVVGGTRRIRVSRWLEDDPYPRAEVEDWPDDDDPHDDDAAADDAAADDAAAGTAALAPVVAAWRRVVALRTELGLPGPPVTLEIFEDPRAATWQLSALSPLGPLDRRQLLIADNTTQRLNLLADLLADTEETLRARIQMG